jgi:hypothetical protein
MKYQSLLKTAAVVLAAGVGAGAALAETTAPTPPVMTDVAPLPAEDRNSIGAVVLEDSMVIAQRDHYQRTGAQIGLARLGPQLRAQFESMLAESRNRARTSEMGSGPAPK